MSSVVTPLLLARLAGPWLATRLLAPRLAPAAGRVGIALLSHAAREAGQAAPGP